MTIDDKAANPVILFKRRARRLRVTGVSVLVAGILAAGILYWLRTRSPDVSDDPSMAGFNRAETQQMGVLYGKQGQMVEDWSEDLEQPGTQAIIIIIFSAAIAAGCFYFARLLDYDAETADESR